MGTSIQSMRKLESLKTQLLPSHMAAIIELKAGSQMQIIMNRIPYMPAGPFVEFSLKPDQDIGGQQRYQSSYRPSSAEPHWNPPEKFLFIVADLTSAKIVIMALDYNQIRTPKEIGIGVLNLKDIGEKRVEKKVKIYSEETGECQGEIELFVSTMKAIKAANIREDYIYQYQRWQPVIDWGKLTFYYVIKVESETFSI